MGDLEFNLDINSFSKNDIKREIVLPQRISKNLAEEIVFSWEMVV